MKTTLPLILAALAALVASSGPAAARDIFVETTVDTIAPDPVVPKSLRAAVMSAVAGDVIKFRGTLAVLIEDDLFIGQGEGQFGSGCKMRHFPTHL